MADGRVSRLVGGLLRFSVGRPWLVVAAVGALALSLASFIPRIELRLDGRSLIPRGHPAQLAADRAAQRFGLKDVVVVGVANRKQGIFNPSTLARVAELSAELAAVDGIVPGSVASLATLPRLTVEDDTLDPRPLLSRDRPPDAELALRLRRETTALGLDDGILAAGDGRSTAIYAEVAEGADRGRVLEEVRRLLSRPPTGGDAVHLSGTALAQAQLGEAAARDLVLLLPAVIAILVLVLVLVFRHLAPALVSLAEIGVSLVATAGIMGLAGEAVFVTTLVLPVVLLVIGVSDDVYALNRCFRHLHRHPDQPVEEAVTASFSAVAAPILLTAVTTAVGLLALAATDLEPQRIFGVYGAVAIVASTLLTFTLVPALLVLLRVRPAVGSRRAEGWGQRVAAAMFRGLLVAGPRRTLALLLVLAVAGGLASRRLAIEDNWVRNLPPNGEIARGDRAINELLAGTVRVEFAVADGGAPLSDPERFAALGRMEERLAAVPAVGAVTSVYGEVARVQAALDGADYRSFRQALARGQESLDASEVEGGLLLLAALRRSPLEVRIDAEQRRARVTAVVRDASYSRIDAVLAAAAEMAGGGLTLTPFGDGWISYLAVRLLVVGQVQSVALALLSDALLLLLLFRSLRTVLLAILPILFSVLAVFALLALAGTPLGIANSMFAAIALGIGIDYSIHLVAHYREQRAGGLGAGEAIERAFEVTGPAILKSAVAVAAGLSVLAFSEVLPNRELGVLVCLSLTICALATLVVVPSLVLAAAPKRRGAVAAPLGRIAQDQAA